MAMEALLCVVIIIVGSSMAESYIDDSLPVHSISTCTRTVMHRLDSSDLPSTSRKRLLASSVGTVMPPMLNINCNENGETDNVIFITDAEYGITTPGECDVMSSQRNATCRESAQRSQSITPCMLTGSCNIEGTPVLLQQCGKYSNYLKVEYQCLPGMSNVHGVCDDLSATDVTEVGHLTSPHYPSLYQESVACSCSITAPPGGHIQANLLDFRLEQHSQCTYDYLEFTDGRESRHRLCGEVSSGYKITSDAEQLNVTFHSDDSIKFTGFWLSYKGIGRSSETSSVSMRCTAIPLPTEPPSHQNHANHGNSNDGSQDGNPENRILVGNVAPRSRTDIVRDDSSTDILTPNVTTRRSPVARNVQQLWQRHHERHNLTFPLFVVPDGDVYQQPAAQGNQTTFISTNLAIVIGVCVGGLALMIIINAIGITICCRRMSHAKDASIYTSGTTSRTDTSVAMLSSAASSVSTEYVSLNSTGASYHATGTAKRNAPKTYNTWTYDDSTYGTASRDNSLKTSRDQHRQIADSKYYIRDLMSCEQSDQRSLSGAQIDPLRYQIDPNRHTTGDGYYCKKGYTENIHNTTQNTDVYTDHTDRDSYSVDQCCLGEKCVDGQCHESITSDQHLLHSTLTRYIPPHRMLVPSSVPPTHGYRGASTHTDVQSNDFV